MSFGGKSLQFSDCGQQFSFTSREQEFYKFKGFTNEPKHCTVYRRINKERRPSGNNYGSRL